MKRFLASVRPPSNFTRENGIRCFTIAQYGPLGRLVLESMRIYDTSDLGEIVFNLVDAGLLNKQETDSREAFSRGFSFQQALEADALAHLDL